MMTGSIALDVVIGLVFVYTLYSLLTTTVTELAASIFRMRPAFLVKGIKRMLDDSAGNTIFSDAFFAKPLVKYLAIKDGRRPAYIAARNFSKNLMDVLKSEGSDVLKDTANPTELQKIQAVINNPQHPFFKSETVEFIRSLLEDSQNDLEKFKVHLEQWYDDTMQRVSGWYKKRLQLITFFTGFAIAVIFNVNTVEIVKKLSNDPVTRQQFVDMAQDLLNNKDARRIAYSNMDSAKVDSLIFADFTKLRTQALEANSVLSVEWGWKYWSTCKDFFLNIAGWMITAIALSLGSPFWFDLLNKLMKLRTGIKPAAEKEDKASVSANQLLTADKREG